jgi:nuclear pore complex protein Nup160
MYQQGRRFGDSATTKMSAFDLAAMQARSYLAAINALKLIDRRNAWISLPGPPPKAIRVSS